MPVTVDLARCNGNGECVKACAFGAVTVSGGKAVIYDNCTDCGACVLACPTGAIWSDLFSKPAAASALLAIDFQDSSGIAAVVQRASREAGIAATWMTVDPIDAGAAADAIAQIVEKSGFTTVVLPHAGAGPAIAGRVAARIGADLLAGCASLALEDAGFIRAVRVRYGGLVQVTSRTSGPKAVVTLWPRAISRLPAADAIAVAGGGISERLDAVSPRPPGQGSRRVAAIAPDLSAGAVAAATACARALGATIVDLDDPAQKPSAADFAIAFGYHGSTQQNARLRACRVVVALVDDPDAPIAQAADYIMTGDVEANANALLAAL